MGSTVIPVPGTVGMTIPVPGGVVIVIVPGVAPGIVVTPGVVDGVPSVFFGMLPLEQASAEKESATTARPLASFFAPKGSRFELIGSLLCSALTNRGANSRSAANDANNYAVVQKDVARVLTRRRMCGPRMNDAI